MALYDGQKLNMFGESWTVLDSDVGGKGKGALCLLNRLAGTGQMRAKGGVKLDSGPWGYADTELAGELAELGRDFMDEWKVGAPMVKLESVCADGTGAGFPAARVEGGFFLLTLEVYRACRGRFEPFWEDDVWLATPWSGLSPGHFCVAHSNGTIGKSFWKTSRGLPVAFAFDRGRLLEELDAGADADGDLAARVGRLERKLLETGDDLK